MADTQETITDIIAEMRGIRVREFQDYADRLEAAHKRELSKNMSKNKADFGQLVDAAKLREALCEILSYIESFHKYIIPGKREKTTAIFAVADTIRGKARAALAAPPRNCDRFATADEAFHAWNNTVDTPGGGAYVGLMDWLYAPATEQEGGNDGNE